MSRTITGFNASGITLNPATDDPTYVDGSIITNDSVSLYAPAGRGFAESRPRLQGFAGRADSSEHDLGRTSRR
jgi:hypothetical protein